MTAETEVFVHKAERMEKIANENYWDTELSIDFPEEPSEIPNISDIVWKLHCSRKEEDEKTGEVIAEEILDITWIGNRQEEALYKYGNLIKYPTHKAAVMALITGEPNLSDYTCPADARPELLLRYRQIPWDSDAPAFEILKKIANKSIKWVRRIDGEVCEGYVAIDFKEPGSLKHFRIFDSKSGRTLEWSDRFGFHAVALDQIISVG